MHDFINGKRELVLLPRGARPYGRMGDHFVCADHRGLFYRYSEDGQLHPLHGESVRSFSSPESVQLVYWPADADSLFDDGEEASTPTTTRPFETTVRAGAGLQHAKNVFDIITLCVPGAVSDEQVGDAMEIITRLALHGVPTWKILLKTWSTVFWICVDAVRYVLLPRGEKKLPKGD